MAFVGFLSSSGAAIFKLHVDVGLGLRQILPFFSFFSLLCKLRCPEISGRKLGGHTRMYTVD